jgi:hypothetical protein
MILFLPKNFKLFLFLLLLVFSLLNHPAKARPEFISASETVFTEKVFTRAGWGSAALLWEKDAKDQALVLQHCLDLAGLQPYYPKNTDGTYMQLRVLQHGVSFPTDLTVSKAGMPVAFMDKDQIAGDAVDAYFLFFEFDITGKSASVSFVYHYDQTTSLKKMQVVSLELQKAGNTWSIVQAKIEGRQS